MDNDEAKRQAKIASDTVEATLEELSGKCDSMILLSVMLGKAIAIAKMMREAGVFTREEAIIYFGTSLADASAEYLHEEETTH